MGLVVLLSACAPLPRVDQARPPEDLPVTPAHPVARPPSWQPESDATAPRTRRPQSSANGPILFDDPSTSPVLFSQDPELLRAEVAAECRSAQAMRIQDALPRIATALYLSVIDPATGTEALILGNCGTAEAIVREMVAKGGEPALRPVVERALALSAPRARGAIETAGADGLARSAELAGLGDGPTRRTRHEAMAYFPSIGSASRVTSAQAPASLYRSAQAGYGVYTFVLVGPGFERLPEADQLRHRELFRLIETYAGADEEAGIAPQPEAHVFLIPVDAELAGQPLFNQVAAGLSDRMRRQLIAELSDRGETEVAGGLETGAGPFLVTTLAPSLFASEAHSPRLLADLSGLGIEHLYTIVDAFDRGLVANGAGQTAALSALGERLAQGVPRSIAGQRDLGADPAAGDRPWFVILEEPGASSASERDGPVGQSTEPSRPGVQSGA
ncbi:hypothetical protein CKO25_09820 [Thiocapsa imhoffii]|uniref:Uncharacterized protein n=1 Tax=Thiocapsa imhoffii TaxID=382777 RepID=A0A9X1B8N1_9GAMM|nr:hypothetical protein [Thiocapsa imhoffii]